MVGVDSLVAQVDRDVGLAGVGREFVHRDEDPGDEVTAPTVEAHLIGHPTHVPPAVRLSTGLAGRRAVRPGRVTLTDRSAREKDRARVTDEPVRECHGAVEPWAHVVRPGKIEDREVVLDDVPVDGLAANCLGDERRPSAEPLLQVPLRRRRVGLDDGKVVARAVPARLVSIAVVQSAAVHRPVICALCTVVEVERSRRVRVAGLPRRVDCAIHLVQRDEHRHDHVAFGEVEAGMVGIAVRDRLDAKLPSVRALNLAGPWAPQPPEGLPRRVVPFRAPTLGDACTGELRHHIRERDRPVQGGTAGPGQHVGDVELVADHVALVLDPTDGDDSERGSRVPVVAAGVVELLEFPLRSSRHFDHRSGERVRHRGLAASGVGDRVDGHTRRDGGVPGHAVRQRDACGRGRQSPDVADDRDRAVWIQHARGRWVRTDLGAEAFRRDPVRPGARQLEVRAVRRYDAKFDDHVGYGGSAADRHPELLKHGVAGSHDAVVRATVQAGPLRRIERRRPRLCDAVTRVLHRDMAKLERLDRLKAGVEACDLHRAGDRESRGHTTFRLPGQRLSRAREFVVTARGGREDERARRVDSHDIVAVRCVGKRVCAGRVRDGRGRHCTAGRRDELHRDAGPRRFSRLAEPVAVRVGPYRAAHEAAGAGYRSRGREDSGDQGGDAHRGHVDACLHEALPRRRPRPQQFSATLEHLPSPSLDAVDASALRQPCRLGNALVIMQMQ